MIDGVADGGQHQKGDQYADDHREDGQDDVENDLLGTALGDGQDDEHNKAKYGDERTHDDQHPRGDGIAIDKRQHARGDEQQADQKPHDTRILGALGTTPRQYANAADREIEARNQRRKTEHGDEHRGRRVEQNAQHKTDEHQDGAHQTDGRGAKIANTARGGRGFGFGHNNLLVDKDCVVLSIASGGGICQWQYLYKIEKICNSR